MAIIKHISVKNRFYSDAVEYLTCKFDEYTNKPILDEKGRVQERDSYLIEGVNCNADTFGAECIETNRLYGKNNSIKDVKAHHYIISFEPTDDITMEQAMEFGKQWLEVFIPGHQAVLSPLFSLMEYLQQPSTKICNFQLREKVQELVEIIDEFRWIIALKGGPAKYGNGSYIIDFKEDQDAANDICTKIWERYVILVNTYRMFD